MSEPIIISGVAAWAHVNEPSQEKTIEVKGRKSTIPSRYSVQVLLSNELANKLKKEGFNVKKTKAEIPGIEGSEGKPFLEVKKAAYFKDGNLAPSPRCVDSQKQDYDGLIGNGSKVNVKLMPVPYEIMGREGISARLLAVQVVELVEYSGSEGGDDFDTVEGFVASKSAENIVASVGDTSTSEIELDF